MNSGGSYWEVYSDAVSSIGPNMDGYDFDGLMDMHATSWHHASAHPHKHSGQLLLANDCIEDADRQVKANILHIDCQCTTHQYLLPLYVCICCYGRHISSTHRFLIKPQGRLSRHLESQITFLKSLVLTGQGLQSASMVIAPTNDHFESKPLPAWLKRHATS